MRTRYRTPEQLGLLERFHRTLKEEEVYWQLYRSPSEAREKLEAFCLGSQIKWTGLVDFCVTSRPGPQAGTATSCFCPTWSFSSFSLAALAQPCHAGNCTSISPR